MDRAYAVRALKFDPKVLVASNNPATESLWSLGYYEPKIDLAIKPNPDNILQRWVKEGPKLIVIDDNDQEPGILNTIKIRRKDSAIPVLLLTDNKPEEYIIRAYAAGVDECVDKPISPSLFHSKIKAWLRRSSSVPVYVLDPLKVGNVKLIPAEKAVGINDGSPIHLTDLELRLIYVLIHGPGRTVSSEELVLRV